MTAGLVPEGAPVGVVGAGTMGAGIAQVAAAAGHPVRLLDARPGAAKAAVDDVRATFERLVARGKVDQAEAGATLDRLVAVDGVEDLAGCAVVVEAVVEDLAVKRELLAAVEAVVDDSALLATNTSSLSVTAVAAGLRHPGRVVGLHFFNPAPRMNLVEVVRGDDTDPAVVEAAAELSRAWGKTPVVCSSTPGFIVNRVARPYYGEAQRIVEEGVTDPATVDAVLREAGGFPLGPFELTDLVGQDVNLAVSRSVWEQTFHDPRYAPTVFQQRLVDAGRLGRKTGRGVFEYGPDGRAVDARPSTEPRREAPAHVVWHTAGEGPDDPDPSEFPVMAPFLERVRAAGVTIERRVHSWDDLDIDLEADDEDEDDDWLVGIALPGGGRLLEVSGDYPSAEPTSMSPVVLLDWAHDPATCKRVVLVPTPGFPEESLHAAVGLCQAAGVAVTVVRDCPGGIVARTVTMIINEAVELVGRREAEAEDVDVAMLLGTGYPSGPLEWGDRIGPQVVSTVLEELGEAMPTGRYRPSAAFARLPWVGGALREL